MDPGCSLPALRTRSMESRPNQIREVMIEIPEPDGCRPSRMRRARRPRRLERLSSRPNAKKEGVKTTLSGLQYKVVKAGSGRRRPLPTPSWSTTTAP